ncbi:hypothetical protein GJ496_009704 [Pomphorhynchus laevis]|nr:hypothetical protein GJ496_009704 [Pomphorhynchus laevis]
MMLPLFQTKYNDGYQGQNQKKSIIFKTFQRFPIASSWKQYDITKRQRRNLGSSGTKQLNTNDKYNTLREATHQQISIS